MTATTATHEATSIATIVMFRGYNLVAPGFTTETFGRAIERALAEGVKMTRADRPGTFLATRPGSYSSYLTSGTTCTCRAGEFGHPCKHRAAVILMMAICPLGL